MEILCIRCKDIKDSSEFHIYTRSKLGFKTVCKTCRKEEERKYRQGEYLARIKVTQKEYRDTHKKELAEYNRNHKSYNRYGIKPEQYNEAMKSSSICQICGTNEKLNYDHNHSKTGIEAFRGVLCTRCNLVLGLLKDSQELLQNAIEYLKGNK